MNHRNEFSRLIESLGCPPESIIENDGNPFVVDTDIDGYSLRLVVYMFSCINPPGGRPSGEYKINISVYGQTTGMRCNFAFDKGFALLMGYVKSWDVFVLWDAYKHRDFAYRSNAQVKQATILLAFTDGIATQERKLRKDENETVICCSPSNLKEAILMRYRIYQNQIFQIRPKIKQATLTDGSDFL